LIDAPFGEWFILTAYWRASSHGHAA